MSTKAAPEIRLKIKLGDVEVELSRQEARELHNELSTFFKEPTYIPVPQPIPYPVRDHIWPPYVIGDLPQYDEVKWGVTLTRSSDRTELYTLCPEQS